MELTKEILDDVREIVSGMDEERMIHLIAVVNVDLFECRAYNASLIERMVQAKSENRRLKKLLASVGVESSEWEYRSDSSVDRKAEGEWSLREWVSSRVRSSSNLRSDSDRSNGRMA